MLWDESADTLNVTGTVEFDALKGTGAITITNILDEDNMASDSATALATQQSIKAYVDSSVGAADSWAESLAVAVTSGANSPSVASGQALLTNTISETTAASGVTIDSVLLKDNTVLAGTLLLGAGSVTDSSGAITFGNENLTTTGTLGSGAITATGTSLAAKLGVGIALTEGTLHVHTASAGSVTARAEADDLIVESSSNTGISILGSDASNLSLIWGSPTDNKGMVADWNHNADLGRFGTHNVGASLALYGDDFITNLTLSGASGSESAVFAGTVTATDGIYLGGTAAANLLDDYEEGTFTPAIAGWTLASATGTYTKIGNTVFYSITTGVLTGSGSDVLEVTGLPFNPSVAQATGIVMASFLNTGAAVNLNGYTMSGSKVRIYETRDNAGWVAVTESAFASGSSQFLISGTYTT